MTVAAALFAGVAPLTPKIHQINSSNKNFLSHQRVVPFPCRFPSTVSSSALSGPRPLQIRAVLEEISVSRFSPTEPRKGSDVLVESLEREGVTLVFAYPGGASMEIHQALTRSKILQNLLPRHEQGGAFAADGYARATGQPGVCLATSGPGALNLVSGLANALMDSVPVVAITGQVPRRMIGTDAFQETPIIEVTRPITKHNYLVSDANDIPRIVKEAFFLARSGRPGPVLIDIPKDIQQQMVVPDWDQPMRLNSYSSRLPKPPSLASLEEIARLISESNRPVLYVGGGCLNATEELRRFVELTGVPVVSTLMGLGCYPSSEKEDLGMQATDYAVEKSDLLLAFGVGIDVCLIRKLQGFGSVVHVDADSVEIGEDKLKKHHPHLSVCADMQFALRGLNSVLVSQNKFASFNFGDWIREIKEQKRGYVYEDAAAAIRPEYAIRMLDQLIDGNSAIVATGSGRIQRMAAELCRYKSPRQFLTSSHLGATGFGLPAGMAAAKAKPDTTVIDIDGHGSFMSNVQELVTVGAEKIPIKILLLNDQHVDIVLEPDDDFYESDRAITFLGNPNMVELAEGCGVEAARVMNKCELRAAMRKMLETPGPYLLDVLVPYHQGHGHGATIRD